jgi:uncharacterized membrane protein YdbT with pleckstrin-like domain
MITLEDNEKIVLTIRKHWWRLFTWGWSMAGLALGPVIVFVVFFFFTRAVLTPEIINLFGFFYTMWIGMLWALFFVEWTDYRFDIWIVTNQRIIDIDQVGLFSRDIATVRLSDVEDITVEMYGFVSTIFKFGTLMVQTAGSKNEFFIKNAKSPEQAKAMIYTLIHNLQKPNNND